MEIQMEIILAQVDKTLGKLYLAKGHGVGVPKIEWKSSGFVEKDVDGKAGVGQCTTDVLVAIGGGCAFATTVLEKKITERLPLHDFVRFTSSRRTADTCDTTAFFPKRARLRRAAPPHLKFLRHRAR